MDKLCITEEQKEKYIAACLLAREKHKDQKRKYTGEPYFNHVLEVAEIVEEVTNDVNMWCAAVLHDTVEDCGVPITEICDLFGPDVANLVQWLTDVSKPEDGNRAARKEIDRRHTAAASPRAKTIKLADFLSNMQNVFDRDPKFAAVYAKEKRALMPDLVQGNPILYARAEALLSQVEAKLHEGSKIGDRVIIYGAAKQLDGPIDYGPILGTITKIVPKRLHKINFDLTVKQYDEGYILVKGKELQKYMSGQPRIVYYRAHPKQCRRLIPAKEAEPTANYVDQDKQVTPNPNVLEEVFSAEDAKTLTALLTLASTTRKRVGPPATVKVSQPGTKNFIDVLDNREHPIVSVYMGPLPPTPKTIEEFDAPHHPTTFHTNLPAMEPIKPPLPKLPEVRPPMPKRLTREILQQALNYANSSVSHAPWMELLIEKIEELTKVKVISEEQMTGNNYRDYIT